MNNNPNNKSLASPDSDPNSESADFIRAMVAADIKTAKHQGAVVTRFPPEPNGYLHIGHAKSICLNFGVANEFHGRCHLRFDDTNPATEDTEYVESIQNDVRWLGFDWGEHLHYASDYFERLYDFAVVLIRRGKAYVDSSTDEEIRQRRGTINEPGTPGPYRDRSVAENLDLFERMRRGEFADGTHVLRAKIDLSATNMKMRDPLLYRIRMGVSHHRTGDNWCIYPFYDFAHCLSDAIEEITHSICTLEFENNRELYDWVLDNAGVQHPRPGQTEFARLNMSYTVMSKRKLLRLVQEGYVRGWDDPRMPTLSGMRRRGIRPSAIRAFCEEIGVARTHNVIDLARFEHVVRDDLNLEVPRAMCVIRPLEAIIDNYPEDQVEDLDAPYYPRDVPLEGTRVVPFSRRIFVEREDFSENPPKGWFRLSPGGEVRLRYAYIIRCDSVEKDSSGEVIRLRCSYDSESRGGAAVDGRKVKGTIHWVSAEQSVMVEVRAYDRLFSSESPDSEEGDFVEYLNPSSLEVIKEARLEPAAAEAAGVEFERYQFERQGYFAVDADSAAGALVFNRIVSLRDTWAKRQDAPDAVLETSVKTPQVDSPNDSRAVCKNVVRNVAGDSAVCQKLVACGVELTDAEAIACYSGLDSFFDAAIAVHSSVRSVAKWVVNEVLRELKTRNLADFPFSGSALGELVQLVDSGQIT
ncbi:MAG: glutamine--tRNA ligase/YqeY domain fusion protein, partial [Polyangiaceae bacterium]|nr:glutamine--tRNA ligase/YqeY domain fusion protein [Polyangiaceae bacterium]